MHLKLQSHNFFSDDESRLDLTKEQKEILEIWDGLDEKEREIFYDFYPQPEEVMDSSTKMRAIFFI